MESFYTLTFLPTSCPLFRLFPVERYQANTSKQLDWRLRRGPNSKQNKTKKTLEELNMKP
jgi:hypothetical protein